MFHSRGAACVYVDSDTPGRDKAGAEAFGLKPNVDALERVLTTDNETESAPHRRRNNGDD
jgi:hypothetical protein